MRNRMFHVAMFLLFCASAAFGGAKGGSQSATVQFNPPELGADGERIDGDGGGIYADGRDKVSAKIDSSAHNNDVVLDLSRTRGARALLLDLTDCADVSCDGRPFDRALVWDNVILQTRAARLLDFEVGATAPVRLWVHFRADDTGWWIRLDAEDRETDCRSHSATATRTAENEWVITAGTEQLACLLTLAGSGKEARGKFRVPHRFTVRLQ